jgi:hypothetical protein
MFFYTLVLGTFNREAHERNQHSGEITSKYFNKVLKAVNLLSVEIIKPVDPEFLTTREIIMNSRYILHFKITYKIISD